MIRLPPRSTRTDTLFPYATLFLSSLAGIPFFIGFWAKVAVLRAAIDGGFLWLAIAGLVRSEEHTSELQSLMRISYAVFCLKKKTNTELHYTTIITIKFSHELTYNIYTTQHNSSILTTFTTKH